MGSYDINNSRDEAQLHTATQKLKEFLHLSRTWTWVKPDSWLLHRKEFQDEANIRQSWSY